MLVYTLFGFQSYCCSIGAYVTLHRIKHICLLTVNNTIFLFLQLSLLTPLFVIYLLFLSFFPFVPLFYTESSAAEHMDELSSIFIKNSIVTPSVLIDCPAVDSETLEALGVLSVQSLLGGDSAVSLPAGMKPSQSTQFKESIGQHRQLRLSSTVSTCLNGC